MASSRLIDQAVPDLKGIRYDFGRREFVYTDTGGAVEDTDFTKLAQSAGARAAKAGATTLKRSVLVNTLVQGAGGAGWRPLLGAIARFGGIEGLDPALKGISYSIAPSELPLTEETTKMTPQFISSRSSRLFYC